MAKKKTLSSFGDLVYSTNPDYIANIAEENKEEEILVEPKDQDLRVFRESKGRGGKTVSIVKGFVGSETALEELAKKLKTFCGVGGSVKDGEIIIQGDMREKICAYLEKNGYKFKRSGG